MYFERDRFSDILMPFEVCDLCQTQDMHFFHLVSVMASDANKVNKNLERIQDNSLN